MTTDIVLDIGTSSLRVGVKRNNRVELLALDGDGATAMPAYVAFTDSGRLFGRRAKAYAASAPENVIFRMLRFLGGSMRDLNVRADCDKVPFRVVASSDDKPQVRVTVNGQPSTFDLEEVMAMLLEHTKAMVDEQLAVRHVTLTVPASFTTTQRRAVLDAAAIAGLTVRKLLNAPTAALVAYMATHPSRMHQDRTVVTVTAGAGSLGVAITIDSNDVSTAVATTGNAHLGGIEIDERLVRHCIAAFERTIGRDVHLSPRGLQRLRTACEDAKIALSTATTTTIEVPRLSGENDLVVCVSRDQLNALARDVMTQLTALVVEALRMAKMEKANVDAIVLAGGLGRMPLLQTTLVDLFHGQRVRLIGNPSEAIVTGATLYTPDGDVLALQSLPTPFWVATEARHPEYLLRGSTEYFSTTEDFYTTQNKQSDITLLVYEGLVGQRETSHLQGKWRVGPLPKSIPRGASVQVSFQILDATGTLDVSATVDGKEIPTANELAPTTRGRMRRLIEEAATRRRVDGGQVVNAARAAAKAATTEYTMRLREAWHGDAVSRNRVSEATRDELDDALAVALKWLILNPNATIVEYNAVRFQLEAVGSRVIEGLWDMDAAPSWRLPAY
ncbi:hypothetical protein SPRG_00182 [Saprolegnia parasitica CBS 223.65]|uniref:Uncharacterized protein n=1 Tax=Saprolegnia parasitica (strain CBS 223.65) TaxID=695850 RepID=A0A067CXW3_SAPPC|nr:hypothetical protein SPRG_00182 [Saprolegnia parasitica CBS 223.65]KDO35333.1 hypothetical protein SPRG_00182 [Saprolegnia parasitica CBS 223.65]|eukprot:XP_012193679.1 hypothetical protein SPRG_00182 [Saprolegnia parasitica CBS 223.65]